jgi:hypothetical protein
MPDAAKLAYVAAPYSDPDPAVIAGRMAVFDEVIADLLRSGRWFPISPLMNHAVVGKHALPGDWDFWQHYSRRLLARCDDLIVITMPGWKTSRGVQSEITLAGILSLPVHHHEQWSRQTYQAAHDRQDD